MDLLCLLGICDAAAQAASAAAPALADTAASAAPAAPAASAAAGLEGKVKEEVALVATFAGIISVILAQLRSARVVRRYAESLLGFMGAASQKALGRVERTPEGGWTAANLLAGMEHQRLAVLYVLVGVVLVYSLAAAGVLIAYSGVEGNVKLTALSVAVSFFMFASFSGPVVLLGVSASNFGRLFWTYFAPATFAAVAMQVMVSSVTDPEEKLSHVVWALFMVLALTASVVALRTWVPRERQKHAFAWLNAHRWLGSLLLALLGIVFVFILGASMRETSFLYLLGGCTVGALAIALCYYTMVDRIRRIVAPLLAAGYFAAIVATFGVLAIGFPAESDHGVVVSLLIIALALAAGWLARSFMLSWIGLAYEQKVFSDAQFQVFCWMITVAGVVVSVATVVRENGSVLDPLNLWLLAATVIALVAYWAVTRYGVKPLPSNKRLLVLRVFSRDRRGERLLDGLEYRWRFIGPIVLIGGKDVAERTIDPAKAANFLRGRLKDIFVPDAHELNRQVVAMDETPDPDGRYRINEFFCFDDTWKDAVRMLLDSSDAIVLDLSEFTADRQGTAFELGLLRERGALPRTVFLVSAATDLDAVCSALHLPPGSALPAGSVIQVERSVDGKQLVEALVQRIPTATPAHDTAAAAAVALALGAD